MMEEITNKELWLFRLFSPLPILMWFGGLALGILNGYPDPLMMLLIGLVEGFVFYGVGVYITYTLSNRR